MSVQPPSVAIEEAGNPEEGREGRVSEGTRTHDRLDHK